MAAEQTALPSADLSWHDRASCARADPEMFFAEQGRSLREAVSLCQDCPVRRQCLTDALSRPGTTATGGYGTWGGTSPAERAALKRRFGAGIEAAAAFALSDTPVTRSRKVAARPAPTPGRQAA